jgi:alpha-1,3-rhamnosyltransferase
MNIDTPLVSVLIPSYNNQSFVIKCIQGVLNQSYRNIELIIIDDGSTDSSPQLINEFNSSLQSKFKFISQSNIGLPKTINYFLTLVTGKYFCLCASDDFWVENKIELQVKYMESFSFKMCFGKVIPVDLFGNILNNDLNSKLKGGWIFNDLMLMKFHPPVNYMYLTETVLSLGGFDEEIHTEDYYMNLKIAEKYEIGFIDEYLSYYRLHSYKNSQIVKQYISHLKSINHFKNSDIYSKALMNWHWNSMAVYTQFIGFKMQGLISLFKHAPSFYKLHYIKSIFKLLFIWRKI